MSPSAASTRLHICFGIHISFLFVGTSRLLDLGLYMHTMLISFMSISGVSMHQRQIILHFRLSAMWASIIESI